LASRIDWATLEIEALYEGRNGGDLVRFLEDGLSDHQLGFGGAGWHQIQGFLVGLSIVAAARGLAVD
jgi:hypothetical protein